MEELGRSKTSIQAAWRFIQEARGDATRREALEGLVDASGIGALVELGAERGFAFTAEELRAAHRHDWAARWLRRAPLFRAPRGAVEP